MLEITYSLNWYSVSFVFTNLRTNMMGVEPGISHKEIEEYPEEYYNPVEGLQKQLDFKEMVAALSNHSVSQWIDNYLSTEIYIN